MKENDKTNKSNKSNKSNRTDATGYREAGALEAAASWSAVPDPRTGQVGTKMDWIQGLSFKSERGVEILPPETVSFYHDLHAGP